MKKVSIAAHHSVKERVVAELQEMGVMQLLDIEDEFSPREGVREGDDESGLRQTLAELKFVIDYLDSVRRKGTGFIQSFLDSRIPIGADDLARIEAAFDHRPLYTKCRELEARLGELRHARAAIESRLAALSPWVALDVPVEELQLPEHVCVYAGSVQGRLVEALVEEISSSTEEFHFAQVSGDRREARFVLFYLKTDETVPVILKRFGCAPAQLAGVEGTVDFAVRRLRRELEAIQAEQEEIARATREMLAERVRVLALYDRTANLLDRDAAGKRGAQTRQAFALQGWVRAGDLPMLQRRLSAIGGEVEIRCEDPAPGERVPVALENAPLIRPFEFVTSIYGLPGYDEIDPTPILAPFFLVYFGLMLGDAGYGIILMLLGMFGLKRIGGGASRFFQLLFYLGISTVVFGAVTGSWFGNAPELLPPGLGVLKRAREALTVLDPMQSPVTMLVVALALGLVQVLCGIGVKMYATIRRGRTLDALFDQGLWIVFLPSLVLAVGGLLPAGAAKTCQWLALGAAGGIVLTHGRRQRNLLLRPFVGLYALYGAIGYFSDVLSYSRILALGLGSGVIALVVNQMALLTRGMPVVGIVLTLGIMAGGHTFNLLINVLGSFIHSGRLQFVEFFTKFFEGGGKAFRPFSNASQYTVVRQR